jgi:protocatechuate 3,4-dioxygenase beta subunit
MDGRPATKPDERPDHGTPAHHPCRRPRAHARHPVRPPPVAALAAGRRGRPAPGKLRRRQRQRHQRRVIDGSTGGTGGGTCTAIPEETGGPYPGDGTNSNGSGIANALALSGIVHSDIRTSVAPGSATAAGIRTTLKLQIVNVGASCADAAGAAVYLWHCDRDGNYSMYANGLTRENYLRGVQEADSTGTVSFTTIFPGCYAGRMPHIHFEVYPSLAKATGAANRVKTSQFTFPLATLNEVYATSTYASSARNLAGISYATDNVFSDGTSLQMASVSGDPVNGYVVTLTIGVSL